LEAATIAVSVSTLGCVVNISYRVSKDGEITIWNHHLQCRKIVCFEPSLLPSCKQKQAMVMMKSTALHLDAFLRERASGIIFDCLLHTRYAYRGKKPEGRTERWRSGKCESDRLAHLGL
jgi:hypothetical protein